ncbi:MAG: DNA mismatch repair protein MutL, partial [Saprospiraceae bacterium]|nr:DNA mismatch repair protein MutL [Saprospiraceae bacterium]
KFEDERLVYDYLKVSVRHALGQHSIMPTLDFDQEGSFSPHRWPSGEKSGGSPSFQNQSSGSKGDWQALYEGLESGAERGLQEGLTLQSDWDEDKSSGDSRVASAKQQKDPYQVHASYIVSHIKSGFLLIDQHAAHQRILYEHFLHILSDRQSSTQQQLFPKTIELSPADSELFKDLLPEVNKLGFDIQEFGKHTFVINGVPGELTGNQAEEVLIEKLLEQYKSNRALDLDMQENIARSMAHSAAARRGQILEKSEMQAIIDRLFACEMPYKSPSGRNCFLTFDLDELDKRFEQ